MTKLKAISLFCGCGGADVGLLGGFEYLGKRYPKLPFKIVHASDINAKAVDTYNRNFSHSAVVGDVRDLKLKNFDADVVLGGFPCQPFSTVNPTKDPANRETQLFWEMARVIEDVRPRVFVAENVQGFYRLAGGKYFDFACEEFARAGYKLYHKLIDS